MIFVSLIAEKWYSDLHFFNYKWDWAYFYGFLSLISFSVECLLMSLFPIFSRLVNFLLVICGFLLYWKWTFSVSCIPNILLFSSPVWLYFAIRGCYHFGAQIWFIFFFPGVSYLESSFPDYEILCLPPSLIWLHLKNNLVFAHSEFLCFLIAPPVTS